jgi:CubicO group peptidase (beta-lactamase class C family)
MRIQTLMRHSLILLGFLSPLVSSEARCAPPPKGLPPEVDAYLEKARKDWGIPGLAVAVVQRDTVVAKGYGIRELGKPEPVDENTVFDAASLTKSFTAALAAILVDEGKMKWDDPVRRYLPDLMLPDPYLAENATLRDFLSHRTGLQPANMMWLLTAIPRAEVLRRVRCLKPAAPFRADMIYSNVGYTVAGEAIAAAAGTTYETLLRDRLIVPLGLKSTTWSYAQAAEMPNHASPHAWIEGAQRPIRRETQRASNGPAGAVQSSAADLARWMRFQLDGGVLDGKRLVSEASLREMHSPQVIIPTTPEMRAARLVEFFAAYGLGWQVMDYRGNAMLWHTGNGNGQIAFMALIPKQRLGVVVLVNTWAAPFVHGALINHLLDVYLGYKPRDWSAEGLARAPEILKQERKPGRDLVAGAVPGSKPSRPLASYGGAYESCLFGPIHVRLEAAGLTLQMGEGQKAELLHHHGDSFVVLWRDPLFREERTTLVSFDFGDAGAPKLAMQIGRDQIEAVARGTASDSRGQSPRRKVSAAGKNSFGRSM